MHHVSVVFGRFFKIGSTYGKFHEMFNTQKVGRKIYLLSYFKSLRICFLSSKNVINHIFLEFSFSRRVSDYPCPETAVSFRKERSHYGKVQYDQPESEVAVDGRWQAPPCEVCPVPEHLYTLCSVISQRHHRLSPGSQMELSRGWAPEGGQQLPFPHKTRSKGNGQAE